MLMFPLQNPTEIRPGSLISGPENKVQDWLSRSIPLFWGALAHQTRGWDATTPPGPGVCDTRDLQKKRVGLGSFTD